MSINVKAGRDAKCRHEVNNDSDINQLKNLSPQEMDNWVEENVKSFVDVRKIVKVLLKSTFIKTGNIS